MQSCFTWVCQEAIIVGLNPKFALITFLGIPDSLVSSKWKNIKNLHHLRPSPHIKLKRHDITWILTHCTDLFHSQQRLVSHEQKRWPLWRVLWVFLWRLGTESRYPGRPFILRHHSTSPRWVPAATERSGTHVCYVRHDPTSFPQLSLEDNAGVYYYPLRQTHPTDCVSTSDVNCV